MFDEYGLRLESGQYDYKEDDDEEKSQGTPVPEHKSEDKDWDKEDKDSGLEKFFVKPASEFIVDFFDAFSNIDDGGVALMMEYMDGESVLWSGSTAQYSLPQRSRVQPRESLLSHCHLPCTAILCDATYHPRLLPSPLLLVLSFILSTHLCPSPLRFTGGSLQDIVDDGGCDDEITLSNIAVQALIGLAFLHRYASQCSCATHPRLN
jgi:serine/threonine protein kinase